MQSPIQFQLVAPTPGKWYACKQLSATRTMPGYDLEIHPANPRDRRVAGPFDGEQEAKTAIAELAAMMECEVWQCPSAQI